MPVWVLILFFAIWPSGFAEAAAEAICSNASVIFCDNWEDRPPHTMAPSETLPDLTPGVTKTFSWQSDQTGGQAIVQNGQSFTGWPGTINCHDGTKCFAQTYFPVPNGGNNGGGGFIGTFPLFATQRSVYLRVWVQYPSNYVHSQNGAKFIFTENGSVTGEPRILTEEVTGANPDFPALNSGYMPNFGPNMNTSFAGTRLGQWQCVETHVTSASPVTAMNGSWEAWVNDPAGGPDIQVASYTNIGPWSGFSNSPAGFADYLMSAYWNCQCSGNPAAPPCGTPTNPNGTACADTNQVSHGTMVRLIDSIVVSTSRIGCGGGTAPTPPGTPANLAVSFATPS